MPYLHPPLVDEEVLYFTEWLRSLPKGELLDEARFGVLPCPINLWAQDNLWASTPALIELSKILDREIAWSRSVPIDGSYRLSSSTAGNCLIVMEHYGYMGGEG